MADKPGQGRGRGRGRGRRLYKQNPAIGAIAHTSYTSTGIGQVPQEMISSIPEEIMSLALETELPMQTLPDLDMQLGNIKFEAPVTAVPDPSTLPHVRITEVMDPSYFYAMVAYKEHLESFDQMSSVLIDVCEAHDLNDNFLPRVDDIIGVNTTSFENFGLEYKWVRGRVIRNHLEGDIEVYLLDFGSAHRVNMPSICSRIPDSTLIPCLSMHCGLADCQPIAKDWSRDACDYFHSLISKFSPHLRGSLYIGTTLNSVITGLVLLGYDSERREWISFGRALIQAGHAVTYRNTNMVQYQSAFPHQQMYSNQYQQPIEDSQYLPVSPPPNTRRIDELQEGMSSLHMTSHAGGDAYYTHSLTYREQRLLENLHNDAYFRSHIASEHRIRSLDSVTDYEEFVPKVHPMDVSNGETEGSKGVPQSRAAGTEERDEDKGLSLFTPDKSSDFQELPQPLPPVDQPVETETKKAAIPPHKVPPPSGYKSPGGMGRGQVIKQNMQRARISNTISARETSLVVSNGELSMRANITVTPEGSTKETESLFPVEMVPNPECTEPSCDTTQNPQFSSPKKHSTSSSERGSKLDQEVRLAFEGDSSIGSNSSTKPQQGDPANQASSAHTDGESNPEYAEEFEQSFGHSKNDSPKRPYKGRGRRSPAHWKQGVRAERRHKPPLPSGKDPQTLPIPLASKYVKSITSEAKAKSEPTLQETEIAHLKAKLAAQLDNLLANFREETQRQFPDNIMKLMNDKLANKLTTILGPKGPFLLLLNCIFQRSIDQPNFLPFSFMVIARLYSMYKQVLTENLLPSLVGTQFLLLSKLKTDSPDASAYKANYCQMVSACIDFVSSKEINQGLMAALESAILEILLNFAGSELDLPIEDLESYQIKADCLFTILEKSGRVLLNLKNDCFNQIKQEISYNVSEFKFMPFPLLNKYTGCLELFEKVLSAGKQGPLGLTSLASHVVMPPQPQESILYTNQTYQHIVPSYQTDPRAQLHNLCTQQQYAPSLYPQFQSMPTHFQTFHKTDFSPAAQAGYVPPNYLIQQPQGHMFLAQNQQQVPIPNQQQQQIPIPNQQQQQIPIPNQQQQIPIPNQQQQQQIPIPNQQQQQIPIPNQQQQIPIPNQQIPIPNQQQQQIPIPNQQQQIPIPNQQQQIPIPNQQQQQIPIPNQQQQQQIPIPNQQQQQQIPIPNQQQQQQIPIPNQQQIHFPFERQHSGSSQLQTQTSVESNTTLSPVPVPLNDPFEKIRNMLLSFKEVGQLKKFEDARIQDDLLSIEWLELEKILKESLIPPGLIFRIKRYLSQTSQGVAPTQQQQQQQQQTNYTGSMTHLYQPVQDINTNVSNLYPLSPQQIYPHLQQTDTRGYYQQQQQQQHIGLSQDILFQQQQQHQVLNPNITNDNNSNSNNNNNNNYPDPRYKLQPFMLQPSLQTAETTIPIQTQFLQQQQQQQQQQLSDQSNEYTCLPYPKH